MKRWILCLSVFALMVCGCTTSTSNVKPGKESVLRDVTTIAILPFECKDTMVAKAVQNTIIETLLPTRLTIVQDKSKADVVLQGTITFSKDKVSSGSGVLVANSSSAVGSAHSSESSGGYVSGVTAQVIKNGEIIAAATETQVRSEMWIPDPPEVMARKIAKKIGKLMRTKKSPNKRINADQ